MADYLIKLEYAPGLEYEELESMARDAFPECKVLIAHEFYALRSMKVLKIKKSPFIQAWINIRHKQKDGFTYLAIYNAQSLLGRFLMGYWINLRYRKDFYSDVLISMERELKDHYTVLPCEGESIF